MKFYDVGNRDIVNQDLRQGGAYMRHVQAMTAESLHSKSDIAAELAHRDILLDRCRKIIGQAGPAFIIAEIDAVIGPQSNTFSEHGEKHGS